MTDEPLPKWKADVPAPETCVVEEDGRYRAELTNYVQKGDRVKDIRVRGPARPFKKEARKDAIELRKAAYRGCGTDPALFHVRARRKELESIKWTPADLAIPELEIGDEKEEKRLKFIEEKQRQEREKQKLEDHAEQLLFRLTRKEGPSTRHKPVGPNWQRPGSMVQLPELPDHPANSWFIHEKQDTSGKYRAWLFFNSATGKYYRHRESGAGYIQAGVPHAPQEYPVSVRIGSANLHSQGGKKLDMAVLLPELHKTGFLLKQPLEFLDKPAALFVLCDGLRNAAAAAEFSARKLHAVLLPKLSARATEWEDFELADLLRDAVEGLDALLLESPACYAGCSLAVGLLAGTRLVLGALGGVRCLLCRPPAAPAAGSRRAAGATPPPWAVRLVAGGEAHTCASEEERLRLESAGNRLATGVPAGVGLTAGSARPATLARLGDERERLLLQVARAANPFAALGVTLGDLREGPGSIRRVFRKRSLVVHPDKVDEALRPRAVAAFAKLEAAATSVEAMLQADAAATSLLAEIDAAHDEGRLGADPAAAAQLLGVKEGSGDKAVKQAVENKFHAPLSRLQKVVQRDVDRALRTLEVAEETVARGTALWTPLEADEAVSVTRALGCKDLKAPAPLLSVGLAAECVELEPGTCVGVALLADGVRAVEGDEVARQLARHCPARPRAASLRLALQGAARHPSEAVAVICAYFDFEPHSSAPSAPVPTAPTPKRARTARPERVRVSHILLRWVGLRGGDEFARLGLEAPSRSQAEAELELLDLLEQLLAEEEPKTLAARFKVQVLKRSECASALHVPYADLGWLEPGGAEAPLEAAAFATPVGGLSDVVVSSRGAHLMYRLA